MLGLQQVIDEVGATNPKAKAAKPEDFIEPKFVKQLDDAGFYKHLYGK